MPGSLTGIIRTQFCKNYPMIAKLHEEQGTLDEYVENLNQRLNDEILDRQQELFEKLKEEDPRIEQDYTYRSKTAQWCLHVAREEVIEPFLNNMPDLESLEKDEDDDNDGVA